MGKVYNRNGFWYVDTYISKRRIRKKIGRTKKLAEDALRKIESEALQNRYQLLKDKPRQLFENLIKEYIELESKVRKSKKHGEKRDRITLNHFVRLFSTIKWLDEIEYKHATIYCAKRSEEGVLNSTINREIHTLKAILTYAVNHEYIETSPFKKFKELPQPKQKPPFLEVEEASKLIEASKNINPQIHMFIAIGIFTGLRKAEIINLKWKDINWERNELTVQCTNTVRTKSNKFRILPIENSLKDLLRSHKKLSQDFEYVISDKKGKPYSEPIKGIKASAKLAGIKKEIHSRTLRTTACSFWASTGVPMRQAQLWMGHSDINITSEIYSMIVPSIAQKYSNTISSLFAENLEKVVDVDFQKKALVTGWSLGKK